MAVITRDVLIRGMKRDDVLAWLGEPANHARILDGAFAAVDPEGANTWKVVLACQDKTRSFTYRFDRIDDSHGGRRVLCSTHGKRVQGKLHYSLRTMKPSTNTMITLHADYEPGGMLGRAIDSMSVRPALEQAWQKAVDNLERALLG